MGSGGTPTLSGKPYRATYQHMSPQYSRGSGGTVKLGETRTSVMTTGDGYLSLHDEPSSKRDG